MPRLLADCLSCGSPIYDIEGQTKCPKCGAVLPEWFSGITPEVTRRQSAVEWIAGNVGKIEHVSKDAFRFGNKYIGAHWLIVLNDGEQYRGQDLGVLLLEVRHEPRKDTRK